ncbi:MAG TPA: O-antigen ligase family protein [Verrucomicrobiae bacterium]|jgi:O-antigen ligase|nr:O-antigen ligase family protein [Verrucomicrobiae bacterium]
MNTTEIAPPTDASLKSSPRLTRANLGALACFGLFVVVGCLGVLNPLILLGCAAAAITLVLVWLAAKYLRRVGLELWQVFALTALSGYLLLNYGFENLSLHVGGFPIIISYGLMYGALGLAVLTQRHLIARALKEPPVLCALALLVLAFCHLVLEVPQFGVWALRDSTMCLDAVFMLLGLAWAMKRDSLVFITRWMTVIFSLNMLYGFTLPWGEKLWAWSPESGVFLKVPILGNYNGTGDLLLAGAVFCICVGSFVVKRPAWLMLLLAAAQFLGVAITQVRRMYVGAVIVLIILVLLGEVKKFAKLFVLVPVAILVILLATTVGGLEISGRIGPVNLAFFKDHIRSIETSEGTPGSSIESRFGMADEALGHFYSHPVFGVGFGEPLLKDIDQSNGAAGRVPHNSSLTYLARLGAVGLALWIAFHFSLLKRFVYTYRQRHSCDRQVYAFLLWFFLFYVLFMLASFVEPPFEFPSGAVPFYFWTGFALGLMRWRLVPQGKKEHELIMLVNTTETV